MMTSSVVNEVIIAEDDVCSLENLVCNLPAHQLTNLILSLVRLR